MPIEINKYGEKRNYPLEHIDNSPYYHYRNCKEKRTDSISASGNIVGSKTTPSENYPRRAGQYGDFGTTRLI